MKKNNNGHSTLVECPYCKRKLNSEKANGESRKIIHCRCKNFSKHHTVIFWVSGTGYYISDENMNLIPVLIYNE